MLQLLDKIFSACFNKLTILLVGISLLAAGPSMCAPDDYLDCVTKAIGAIENGRTLDALKSLRMALSCNANDPLAHTTLGLMLLCGSRPDDANDEFSAALKVDPKCAEAAYGLGLVQLARGRIGAATTAFCEAQSIDPSIDMRVSIEYVKAIASGKYPAESGSGDETLAALAAISLMQNGQHAQAFDIWKRLQSASARVGFRERAGCSMSFDRSAPLIAAGSALGKAYSLAVKGSSKLATVKGSIGLKADLTKARSVELVSFYVDGRLVAVTNTAPFVYMWDTLKIANGRHTVRIEGQNSSGSAVTEKSIEVIVKNPEALAPNGRIRSAEANDVWARLWAALKLKPSVTAINYNLAVCGLAVNKSEEATVALERVIAANPDYLDAGDMLARLYGSSAQYLRLYKGEKGRREIALTFDDGPKAETADILRILREKGVKATFFLVGLRCSERPDMLAKIVGEGHEVENHTYNHRDLEYLTNRDIEQEIFQAVATVRSITGQRMMFLRPPGGHEGKKLPAILKKYGITPVYWTVNVSKVEGTSKQKMINTVVSGARPGAIVLMHNPEKVALIALPTIIDSLKKQGYSFVTLSELTR